MCRSIKILRNPEHFPDEEEIQAAALQYIRKVSGYQAAFPEEPGCVRTSCIRGRSLDQDVIGKPPANLSTKSNPAISRFAVSYLKRL